MNYTLKNFHDEFVEYCKEIGVKDEYIHAHEIKPSLRVYCEETNQFFDIERIDMDYLMGCRCPSGLEIIVKEDVEEKSCDDDDLSTYQIKIRDLEEKVEQLESQLNGDSE